MGSRLSGFVTGFMVAVFLRHFAVPGAFLVVAACMAVVTVSAALSGGGGLGANNLELEAIVH